MNLKHYLMIVIGVVVISVTFLPWAIGVWLSSEVNKKFVADYLRHFNPHLQIHYDSFAIVGRWDGLGLSFFEPVLADQLGRKLWSGPSLEVRLPFREILGGHSVFQLQIQGGRLHVDFDGQSHLSTLEYVLRPHARRAVTLPFLPRPGNRMQQVFSDFFHRGEMELRLTEVDLHWGKNKIARLDMNYPQACVGDGSRGGELSLVGEHFTLASLTFNTACRDASLPIKYQWRGQLNVGGGDQQSYSAKLHGFFQEDEQENLQLVCDDCTFDNEMMGFKIIYPLAAQNQERQMQFDFLYGHVEKGLSGQGSLIYGRRVPTRLNAEIHGQKLDLLQWTEERWHQHRQIWRKITRAWLEDGQRDRALSLKVELEKSSVPDLGLIHLSWIWNQDAKGNGRKDFPLKSTTAHMHAQFQSSKRHATFKMDAQRFPLLHPLVHDLQKTLPFRHGILDFKMDLQARTENPKMQDFTGRGYLRLEKGGFRSDLKDESLQGGFNFFASTFELRDGQMIWFGPHLQRVENGPFEKLSERLIFPFAQSSLDLSP